MNTIPDTTDPIVGWRMWSLVQVETRLWSAGTWGLCSPFAPVEWRPRAPVRAMCFSCAESPSLECSCGLYAFWAGPFAEDVPAVRNSARSFSPPFASPALVSRCVIGRVAGWGRVVQHTKGWRAGFAYPLSLTVICVGCLVTSSRFERADWICASPAGRRWTTCETHTGEYLNMPCSMRRTMAAADAEFELLARYHVARADLPGRPRR
jgi:hypothetical protein